MRQHHVQTSCFEVIFFTAVNKLTWGRFLAARLSSAPITHGGAVGGGAIELDDHHHLQTTGPKISQRFKSC